jgi:hypothetical protein
MVENLKNVRRSELKSAPSKIQFWRSLKKGFRQNMVSLQVFRSIDCEEYKRTSNPRPRFTYRQAARIAIDFAHDFYVSEKGAKQARKFLLVQRIILLQLIAMLRIQLSSPKGAKHKMQQYFRFIDEVVGAYFDREAIIAHKYFNDRNSMSVLEQIKKGGRKIRFLKRLDNIAWDMAAPRYMEQFVSSRGTGRYFVPMFLTFDEGLRELLSQYPVKGVIFNRKTRSLTPIPVKSSIDYFVENGCRSEIEYISSSAARIQRSSRENLTMHQVHQLIKREYKELRQLI